MEEKEVQDQSASKNDVEVSLVEIGPRFVMTPIVILEGSFSGSVIYENKQFVSPNQIRASLRQRHGERYAQRTAAKAMRQIRSVDRKRPEDPLADEVLYA